MIANGNAAPISRSGSALEKQCQNPGVTLLSTRPAKRGQRARNTQAEQIARDDLKHDVQAAGVNTHALPAILAAADRPRKAAVVAILTQHFEAEHADGGES